MLAPLTSNPQLTRCTVPVPCVVPIVVVLTGPAVVVAVSQKRKSEFQAHAPTHSDESMIIQHSCAVVLPPVPGVGVVRSAVVTSTVDDAASSQRNKSEFHTHDPTQSISSKISKQLVCLLERRWLLFDWENRYSTRYPVMTPLGTGGALSDTLMVVLPKFLVWCRKQPLRE